MIADLQSLNQMLESTSLTEQSNLHCHWSPVAKLLLICTSYFKVLLVIHAIDL